MNRHSNNNSIHIAAQMILVGKMRGLAGHPMDEHSKSGRILGTVNGSRSAMPARMIVDIAFDVLEMRETEVKGRRDGNQDSLQILSRRT